MSDAKQISRREKRDYKLGTNSYDRTSSLLVTLLYMVGVVVVGLAIIYFARRFSTDNVAVEFEPVNIAGRADAAAGLARDPEPPGSEDMPEDLEPSLEDTLTQLSEVASSKSATLADQAIDSDNTTGHGSGLGDSRQAGLGGEGDNIPDSEKIIRYEPRSSREYKAWLDFWKIELAVFGKTANEVHYAKGFTAGRPKQRVGKSREEGRYIFVARDKPHGPVCRKIARENDMMKYGKNIVLCMPAETYNAMYQKEMNFAQKFKLARKTKMVQLHEIERTYFRVVHSRGKFTFVVEEMEFRDGNPQ